MLVLVTGGARSGKSGFAERYAACLGRRGIYVATSRIWDGEMQDRVELHRSTREAGVFPWTTVEEPLKLAELLADLGVEAQAQAEASTEASASGTETQAGRAPALAGREDKKPASNGAIDGKWAGPVILVDCLTLWLTNLLLEAGVEEWTREEMAQAGALAEAEVERLAGVLRSLPVPVLLVTNEVGDGLVPEYPLGRLFRDAAGRMNQRLAALCDQVFLVTAGIPVELKHLAFRLPGEA
ncbi:bifunctional adenosylcobinamide kinase/adenosylcobinamide-phosphate guanylyltransferase [Gorillibacterium sp. sgz5001074]|uniref:bifunctional adenosylcobinamide kinase/adenosylcobinamide-phosphate guanylyltransferase n=1 Tax=Gorillibacterium sp. sgz5001074 TaxID=3446695 RepID=UPI003F676785